MAMNVLAYYATPGPMTEFSAAQMKMVEQLPEDISGLARIIQGLLIHQFVAEGMYGVQIPAVREHEAHLRRASELLDGILAINDAPLATPRKPGQRLAGVCHHFAKLLVAMLRAKGVPARMRYGFGAYFNEGYFEDHSLCEYWNEKEKLWVLADPQFDEVWQQSPLVRHDVLDVPRDQFVTADSAWRQCRNGQLDPKRFGIITGEMRGLWFIAGNIVKDIAALNKMEMLQWDAWTGMPRPDNTMQNKKTLARFDRLAALLQDPDTAFDELSSLYADPDKQLCVPERVFNAARRHLENV